MAKRLFSWIHLSDIHFGHGGASDRWDQRLVLRRLQEDIEARVEPKEIDAILVTGDIAFSGGGRSPVEYADADAWIRETAQKAGVPVDRVFMVPGNHDVNRGVDKSDAAVGALVSTLRPTDADAKPSASIDKALATAADREMLARRQAAYLDFALGFGPAAGSAAAPAVDRLFWRHTIAGRDGLAVRFVGLNTALLCTNGDRGRLALGREQVALAIEPPAARGEIIVVLSHHPLQSGWLTDERYADTYFQNHAHVHLSGHVHEARSEEARAGSGGRFVRVVAGASHGEAMPEAWIPASHGYAYGEIWADAGGALSLKVRPRLWSEPHTGFVIDVHRVPRERDHAEHALRASLPSPPAATTASGDASTTSQATSSSTARVVPGKPARVFVAYAPADEAHYRELRKHLAMLRTQGEIKMTASREGGAPRGEADPAIAAAEVVLLLLTSEYIDHDESLEVELPALEARRAAGATVYAVLVKPMDISMKAHYARLRSGEQTEAWFEKIGRLPFARGRDQNGKRTHVDHDGIPISTWANADEAWAELSREVREELGRLRKGE